MIAAEIAEYIAGQVAGLTYDDVGASGNVFVGDLPSAPDAAVSVRSTGGEPNDTRLGYDSPTVQVIVRGDPSDRSAGYDTARNIYSALVGLTSTTLPGGTLLILARSYQSEPSDIGQDENGRQEWTTNYVVEVRSLTTHRE